MRNKTIQRKFNLQERIDSLPFRSRKAVMRNLPTLLEVSRTTAYRIVNATVDDTIEMSSTSLIRCAKLFDCKPEELISQPVGIVTIAELEASEETLLTRFSLTK